MTNIFYKQILNFGCNIYLLNFRGSTDTRVSNCIEIVFLDVDLYASIYGIFKLKFLNFSFYHDVVVLNV